MEKKSTIFIVGGTGLVGNAIVKNLISHGYQNLITTSYTRPLTIQCPAQTQITCLKIDLREQDQVREIFKKYRPEYIFLSAAKVGGIQANDKYRADFIYDNLQIQNNVIHSSYELGIKRLLFLGSSCIYPRMCPQPIKEEYLLTGPLEPTNEPYAIAKIAGIKLCESYNKQHGTRFFSVMPTNLYGTNDNFDPETSHVIPALLRKFHEAKIAKKEVTLWGSGTAKREFLHVDDLAHACLHIMNSNDAALDHLFQDTPHLNIGVGHDLSIKQLAEKIARLVGFHGTISWDTSKPDGTPRKVLDVNKLTEFGWQARVGLDEGLAALYKWYVSHTP